MCRWKKSTRSSRIRPSLGRPRSAEAAAILFAQHYAEQLDHFDPAAIANLRQYYSVAQVDEILAYVRLITLANLTGNTADAFLDRVAGHGPPVSPFEAVVGAAVAPVALMLIQLAKLDRQEGLHKVRSRFHRSSFGPRRGGHAEPGPSKRSEE